MPDRQDLVAIDGKTSRRMIMTARPARLRCTWSRPSPPTPGWCWARSPPPTRVASLRHPRAARQAGRGRQLERRLGQHRRDRLQSQDRRRDHRPRGRLSACGQSQSAQLARRGRALLRRTPRPRRLIATSISTRAMAASKETAGSSSRATSSTSSRDSAASPESTASPDIAVVAKLETRTELADRCRRETRFFIASRSAADPAKGFWPTPSVDTGASKTAASTGCSTSRSEKTSHACEKATAQKIWPSSGTSPSTWCVRSRIGDLSSCAENEPTETPNTSSISYSLPPVNPDSLPWRLPGWIGAS